MSEFMFFVGVGLDAKPSSAAERVISRIARRHDCEFVQYSDPGCDYRHWMAGPNLGYPFDDALARAVADDLVAAGIYTRSSDGLRLRDEHLSQRTLQRRAIALRRAEVP